MTLEELDSLYAQTTQGEWHVGGENDLEGKELSLQISYGPFEGLRSYMTICSIDLEQDGMYGFPGIDKSHANFKFMVGLRNSWPSLRDKLRAAEQSRDSLLALTEDLTKQLKVCAETVSALVTPQGEEVSYTAYAPVNATDLLLMAQAEIKRQRAMKGAVQS